MLIIISAQALKHGWKLKSWLKAIVGNLSEEISESDLFELFGLRTTNDLCDNSDVQITLSENTGKKEALIM